LAELLSLHNFTISLQEHSENAKGLFLDFDTNALAAQGRASQVRFEQAKSHDYKGINIGIGFQHDASPENLAKTIP